MKAKNRMKAKLILPFVLALPLGLASCSKKEEAANGGSPSGGSERGTYPLTTCVVSGEELGSMGKAVIYDHEGTSVQFCCKSCIKDFKANPEKYLAKLK
jgi:YHS domain-containing protein